MRYNEKTAQVLRQALRDAEDDSAVEAVNRMDTEIRRAEKFRQIAADLRRHQKRSQVRLARSSNGKRIGSFSHNRLTSLQSSHFDWSNLRLFAENSANEFCAVTMLTVTSIRERSNEMPMINRSFSSTTKSNSRSAVTL